MRSSEYSIILFTVLIFVLLTYSSYSQSILDAVRKGNVQQVAELVEKEPASVNELNNEKTTALHLAASLGNNYIVKYFTI